MSNIRNQFKERSARSYTQWSNPSEWKSASLDSLNLNLDETGIPMAFCDWYGIKHVSIVFLKYTNGMYELFIKTYNPATKTYSSAQQIYTFRSGISKIHTINPIDFDLDGAVDLAITYSVSPMSYQLMILKQCPISRVVSQFWDSELSGIPRSIIPPICMDLDSDGYPDFVGETIDSSILIRDEKHLLPSDVLPATTINRFVWWNRNRTFDARQLRHLDVSFVNNLNQSTDETFPFSHPTSSAFLDIDGDCIPDIVFDVSRKKDRALEHWFTRLDPANHRIKYELSSYLALPKGSQHVSFADVNGDGTIDIIVPVCEEIDETTRLCMNTATQGIQIILNVQHPLCSESIIGYPRHPAGTNDTCRDIGQLCSISPVTWKWLPFISLKSLLPENSPYRFLKNDLNLISIKVADMDLKGYPDFAAILGTISSSIRVIGLFRNVFTPEGHGKANIENTKILDLHIIKLPDDLDTSVNDMAIFDPEEKSQLAILVWGFNSLLVGSKSTAVGALLTQETPSDNYFLKLGGLSGADAQEGSIENRTWTNYGSIIYGGTFKIVGNDLQGSRFVRTVVLNPQTAYPTHQSPHALLGLNYVNNYIEYVYYGVPYTYKNHAKNPVVHSNVYDKDFSALSTHRWTFLITNSFLIANPSPRENPEKWTLELSVSPSNMFWRIFSATLGFLAVITLIIIILDAKEKAEDLKEHQGFRRQYLASL